MTRTQALVLAGHGSQKHPGASAVVSAHADRVREAGAFDEVRTAFWKQEPALHDVRRHVSSDLAYVVPVLTSEGYFATTVFPRELGVDRGGVGPDVRYTAPVGTHDRVTAVLAARIEAARDGPADSVGVAVVGHGTDRTPSSGDATRHHAARLRRMGRYADVAAIFLDQAPAVETLFDRLATGEVVVVPLFVADGHHTRTDIPAALDHPGVGEAARIDGRVVHYTGAVGTDPGIAGVVLERAIEAGATPGSTAGTLARRERSFLDWIEQAPAGRPFGDLLVHQTDTGYGLRHRSDDRHAGARLTAIASPSELRSHVRRDESGRYRPLTGHRTLPSGWRFVTPDARTLIGGVRAVYPGAIAAWADREAGRLDVTPFAETAARQGGRLAGLTGADDAIVTRTARSVCGSCVRTPRWDGATTPATRGTIPCAEACPVLLTAVANSCRDRDGEGASWDVLSAPPSSAASGGGR